MRYTMVVLAVLLLFAASTLVQAGDLNLSYKTMYVGQDAGSIFYDGPVLQADYTWNIGERGYIGVWGSLGLAGDKKGSNFGNEVDFFGGRTFGSVDIGLNYYDISPQGMGADDFLALYINAPLGNISEWNLKIHAEYDWATGGSKCPDGNMYHLSADKKIGDSTVRANVGGHFRSFGIAAEPISFIGAEYIRPAGKDTDLFVRGQLATHSWGMADDALLVGISTKVQL